MKERGENKMESEGRIHMSSLIECKKGGCVKQREKTQENREYCSEAGTLNKK